MGRVTVCFLLIVMSTVGMAGPVPQYQLSPTAYDFASNVFNDVPIFLKKAGERERLPDYLTILGLSGALIYYDQKLLDGSRRVALQINLINEKNHAGRSKRLATTRIGGINADLRVPSDLNSCFYFLGDGLTSLSIIGGLAFSGAVQADNRALNTASQLMESMVLTGMFVITGKYLFGRESPGQQSRPGGAWRPAPGVKNYLAKVSKHDAMPSGHIATAASTVAVLHYNYPEKPWILPVGYTAMGLLMFAMLNNGVHWAGDYPLGIGIGFLAANTVFEMRGPREMSSPKRNGLGDASIQFLPFVVTGGVGLMVDVRR